MKVLVTGGNGYLGTVLTETLMKSGHDVTVLDNMMYHDKILCACNNFIKGDVRDKKVLMEALRGRDAVIHLAAIVGDEACNIKPRVTREINFDSTATLAKLCELTGTKLLFASTCSGYGKGDDILVEESTTDPVSWYGELKVMAEKEVSAIDNSLIFRFGTLFGLSKRMRYDLVVNLFIAKALNGEKITVFGGNQWRPFLHIQDAANAFAFALEKNLSGTFNAAWKNYNITEVAKEIGGENVELSPELHDARNYRVSTKKMEDAGFVPKLTIQDAINEIKDSESRLSYSEAHHSNFKSLLKKVSSGGL